MKQIVVPIVATTFRAMLNCLRDHHALIFIDNAVSWNKKKLIHILMVSKGYKLADFPARRGVFYAKDIDVDQCEVYDPCKLC